VRPRPRRRGGFPWITQDISFGAGWTSTNNWQGDYGNVGDLSNYADYANAHTYPTPGQTPDYGISRINGLAHLAASSRSVITTEVGWDTNSNNPNSVDQNTAAKYTLDAVFDGIKEGNVKTYFYALFDDGSGSYGLMNPDGSAKPAGNALHYLTTILLDQGTPARTDLLNYGLTGTTTYDNTLLMEKSNGTFELVVWNESGAAHNVTLTLGNAAQTINLYDPLTSSLVGQTFSNATVINFTVPDHPVIVEIVPASGGTFSPNPVLTVPMDGATYVGAIFPVTGASLYDPWAAATSGTLALNVSTTLGTVSGTNSSGIPLSGSGTSNIAVSGTFTEINYDLAHLTVSSTQAGTASVKVDVYDQAGVEVYKYVPINIYAPNPVVVVPNSQVTNGGATLAIGTVAVPYPASGNIISGVSVSDPFAAIHNGDIAVKVQTSLGTISGTDDSSFNPVGSGNALSGSGTSTINISGTLAQVNADLSTLTFMSSQAQLGTAWIQVEMWDQVATYAIQSIPITVLGSPPLTVPGPQTTTVGAHLAITGASVSNSWTDATSGTLTLKVTTTQGTISGTDGIGNALAATDNAGNNPAVTGLTPYGIQASGSFSQINTDLANLTFTSSSAGDARLTVAVWDQAGVEAMKMIGVHIT
jgi:hypothetical protein